MPFDTARFKVKKMEEAVGAAPGAPRAPGPSAPGAGERDVAARRSADRERVEEADPGGWPLYVSVLHARERQHRTLAVLARTFDYTCPRTGQEVCVPTTFETDFASIPWWARAVIPPFGRHAKAAVLHDWLYAMGEPKRRGKADRLFRTAMGELNVPWGRRWVMWLAVRFGGGRAYGSPAEWLFSDPETGLRCEPPFPNPNHPAPPDAADTP